MDPNSSSDLIAISVVLINFLVGFAGLLTTHAALGMIIHASKVSSKDVVHIWKKGNAISLTIIPEGLGLLGNLCHTNSTNCLIINLKVFPSYGIRYIF